MTMYQRRLNYDLLESRMSAEVSAAPRVMPVLKSTSDLPRKEEKVDANSLHAYQMWLKEKQMREQEEEDKKMKTEEEDDDSNEENFRVDAVLERGPSPPESETSNTYEWSYEEQFKQLYEIDEDPDRKSFLDEYFDFMKGRGTPVSRIPIMAKQILDLFQLYNLVVKHGGLVQVIRNKQWSKITKGLNLPTSITSAAFTLRTQYLKYLYPYECTLHNFSTPKELQAAIDSNRRDRFSTLYHAEPTMTSTRDDRFGSFPINGCDYPATQPHHHLPHPSLSSSQMDVRYGLKRPSDAMMAKSYDKYGMDSPKVIVLQDGTPSIAESRSGKMSPPSFHSRPRSPLRDSDMRTLAEIEARRRSHHFSYGGKDWDGDARHVIEEEARRRLMDDSRTKPGMICKDKNCNGIDCKYGRAEPPPHRHRPPHDSMMSMCPCVYCKDPRSSYSPPRRENSRHHMDGASATSHDSLRYNNTRTPPSTVSHGETNGTRATPQPLKTENNENSSPMTTLRMKLPDVRKGGNSIKISLEVEGVIYEGVISAKEPITNGDVAHARNNIDAE
ncbi:uncharacterized protein LOC130636018 isoform X2 [Hydractinia symbiolongicarpus]|uniref:uncharacterized protein LOC130636018 isoform X2 n=1 Tax=Hydractinia symbiolongicarpus TaxID=13093 RepID=UPI00254F73E5|nr:uncharacterized protein LOC130636018 isoform X2 [Hydractinia symbiolongicarpus]